MKTMTKTTIPIRNRTGAEDYNELMGQDDGILSGDEAMEMETFG